MTPGFCRGSSTLSKSTLSEPRALNNWILQESKRLSKVSVSKNRAVLLKLKVFEIYFLIHGGSPKVPVAWTLGYIITFLPFCI